MCVNAIMWAVEQTEIPPTDRVVLIGLAKLCRYQDKKKTCKPSIEKLGQICGISSRSVMRSIQNLEASKHIIAEKELGRRNFYTLNYKYFDMKKQCQSVTGDNLTSDNLSQEVCQSVTGTSDNLSPNRSKSEVIEEGTITSGQQTGHPPKADNGAKTKSDKKRVTGLKDIATRILEHLNTCTGSNFQVSRGNGAYTGNTEKIRSILKAGYTEADIMAVIDKKAYEWGSDDKMARFLRPDTLFRISKFENYLQETQAEPPAGNGADQSTSDGW